MIQVEKIDTFTGHKDCVYALTKSDNENHFFSASGDGFVVKWKLDKPDVGELFVRLKNSVYSMIYHEDKLWIIENFEGLHVIDIHSKNELSTLKLAPTYYFDIQIYHNDLFIAGGDGVISVIDKNTLAFKKHMKASDSSARCLAINPVEREFAVGYSDNTIKIFDLQTYVPKKVIHAHQNSVFTLKYSPDFRFLFSGSRDARLKIWDVEKDYEQYQEVVAHTFAINHLDFSPDGKYFITGSMDKSVKIWETERLKLLKVLDKARNAGHGTSVNKVLWTNKNNYIISGSDDRTISVWKIDF